MRCHPFYAAAQDLTERPPPIRTDSPSRLSSPYTRADTLCPSAHSGCSRAAHSSTRKRARRRTRCDMRPPVAFEAPKSLASGTSARRAPFDTLSCCSRLCSRRPDQPRHQDPQSEPAFDIAADDGRPLDLVLRCSPADTLSFDPGRANLSMSSSRSAVSHLLTLRNTVTRLSAYVRHCPKHWLLDSSQRSRTTDDEESELAGECSLIRTVHTLLSWSWARREHRARSVALVTDPFPSSLRTEPHTSRI